MTYLTTIENIKTHFWNLKEQQMLYKNKKI